LNEAAKVINHEGKKGMKLNKLAFTAASAVELRFLFTAEGLLKVVGCLCICLMQPAF
jgi:hypothetical protein